MKKRWLLLPAVLAVAAVAAALLDPTCTVPGVLRGDHYYRSRPTTYWRKALGDTDPLAHLQTVNALKEGGAAAVPVLVELLPAAQNPEAERRWTAAAMRAEIRAHTTP